jgi:Domain of unknown function (DUF4333)
MNASYLPFMRSLNSCLRPFVAAATIVGTVAACGTTVIDMNKLSKAITENVKGALEDGAEVGAVSCPKSSDVKVKAGGTFECSIKVDGQQGRLEITQNDDKGNVEFKPLDAFLIVSKLETEIATGIKDQAGVDARVDCGANGKATLIKAPGDVFTCSATADGEDGDVKVTVKDTDGNIEWEVG